MLGRPPWDIVENVGCVNRHRFGTQSTSNRTKHMVLK